MDKSTDSIPQVLATTQHLRLMDRGGWSYVERSTANGVVSIAARTKQDRIVLIEQYRPPVDRQVIELPAGLSGDLADQADEPFETAARRELLEETGYQAEQLRRITDVASSAGLTDEVVTMFVAEGLERVASGGGDDNENITVHAVALHEVDDWLNQTQASGKLVDARVFAGLYLLQR